MKKRPVTAIISVVIVTVSIVMAVMLSNNKHEGILRLHIMANSNGEGDQAVKLKVRDAVLRFESEKFINVTSAEDAKQIIAENRDELIKVINDVLTENGMDYKARMEIGRYDFPDRTYGNKTYLAGEYEAVRIILGEGEGNNWWCVMFPPLCLTDKTEVSSDGGVEFKSLFLDLWRAVLSWVE